ncbi:hypothetical protein PC129_g15506 [Phytophthora cactorum]|uniref:Uncharacterized protein n=1 Tax=Phytophthora cactorum TaxID=29920 RepID=A0A8T0YM85_9STRA|nr:hypothetical protein Pcac1_g4973 [Phytophthora cactorum]KAG2808476.1 hypothetical protein PC112_g16947 [Phytophthora cactorum]KAG2850185.1 hypothetical protein PC113_g17013 [Phytophthora cactorum]KAG2887638.1 hypothetical protein PC114_g18748 [Phytophthora cactorum]KAG2900005.1 hypothetical protein PC115_g16383 [Phytophthora cactorum]
MQTKSLVDLEFPVYPSNPVFQSTSVSMDSCSSTTSKPCLCVLCSHSPTPLDTTVVTEILGSPLTRSSQATTVTEVLGSPLAQSSQAFTGAPLASQTPSPSR